MYLKSWEKPRDKKRDKLIMKGEKDSRPFLLEKV